MKGKFAVVNEDKLKEFTIEIADICISFLFDQDPFESGVEYINNEFITDSRAEIKLRVHYGRIPLMGLEKKIFDSGSTWSLYRSQGKYVLQDCSFEFGSLPQELVVLEPDFKSGDIYLKNNGFDQRFFSDYPGYPLNQILMIILLSLRKGVLLHACGIDDRGYGFLFLGNSGHGKSTMAKLWYKNHATVFNDDRIIVREKDGEFWMYGTPWHGDFKELSLKGLPIRKVFFLRHSEKNSAVPRKGAEAVSMLLTRSFPPLWDQKGMDYTLGLLGRIASKLPCYNLCFLPDKRIIDFVKNI
ncbi:MAG: hypothetical protein HY739_13155 [Desulfobacterales bacterium]|nr:hypothetical protein [Desulfobacterales bacterium]